MKKLLLALLAIIPLSLSAQQSGFDQLIKKYETRKGVVTMNLQGNILEGLQSFMSSYYDSKSNYDSYDSYSYDDYDDENIVIAEAVDYSDEVAPSVVEEETVADVEESEPEVIVPDDESDEDEDYDYDYYDYDYGDYDYSYDYGSSWDDYIEMFKTYIEGLTYVKAVMYETPNKKFEKDIKRLVVSKKPYRSTFSMRDDTDDIRFYMIDDDGKGNCEMLMIVGDSYRYVAVNILGTVDFSGLMNLLMKYM